MTEVECVPFRLVQRGALLAQERLVRGSAWALAVTIHMSRYEYTKK